MTKDEFIDLVLLNVNGGVFPTGRSAVQRDEVRVMMPIALDTSRTIAHRMDIRERLQTGDMDIRSVAGPFKVTLRKQLQGPITARYIDLGNLTGFVHSNPVTVFPAGGQIPFTMTSREMAGHIASYSGTVFYLLNTGTTTRAIALNMDPTVTEVDVEQVLDIADMGGDEELPLPGEALTQALEFCRAWFMAQRGQPQDMNANNADQKTLADGTT